MLLLAFAQEFDPDIFHTTIDRVIFVFYLFIIVIVLLNVLIAIVNSQYAGHERASHGCSTAAALNWLRRRRTF